MTAQVAGFLFLATAATIAFLLCLATGKVYVRGIIRAEFERDEDPQGFWFFQIILLIFAVVAGGIVILTWVGLIPVFVR